MSHKASTAIAGAFSVAAILIGVNPALSHTIVGNRVFPATLTIDDPGVNDELTLPSFGFLASANFDGTRGPTGYNLGWEYAKTITADLGVSIGSNYLWQRNPWGQGWSNIETQIKYVFYQNAEHEFIIAGAVNAEWGSTGTGPYTSPSTLSSEPYTAITTKLYVGKGFGDAQADWVRPFALTGELDYSFSTHPLGVTASDQSLDTGIYSTMLTYNPTFVTYGATLQYSLLYMNSFVHEVPEFFNRLIPAFEATFTSPVNNTGPSVAGDWPPNHVTTGVFGPSVYYIGNYFQVGVMAQIPINQASGKHIGVLANISLFLDDILPDSLGRPIFGPPQVRPGKI